MVVTTSLVLFVQMGSVHFSVSALPDTVFVRQQVSYEASLHLREAPPPRFLVSPQYTPSDIAGAEVYRLPFDRVRSIRHVTIGRVRYTQYTYRSAIFPLTRGVDTIPPSTLAYTLVDEADPYASRHTTVHSVARRVIVLPLPPEGQPSDFSGAVGQFTLAAAADSQGVSRGNAFTLRVRVTGTGDLALLQRPSLTIPWATIVTTSDSVAWDSAGTLMGGFKEFRWLVTPQSGGRLTIPPVRYSYFDPTTKTYATTVASAIPLTIGDSVPLLEQSRRSIPAPSTLLHTIRQPLVVLLAIVVLAGAIIWGAVRRDRLHNP